MFKGSIVALITPFKNGKIDEKSFQDLVEWQIKQGTHGLVPSGTTGESPTLNHEEHEKIIHLCIEAANGKVPVIAGTGSNSTEEAISLTNYAKKAGADGVLVVTPYYNKPTQQGLFEHFKSINDNCDIPVIIYNIPGRSVVDMNIDTMYELSKLPNIVGVKDASNDLARPLITLDLFGKEWIKYGIEISEYARSIAEQKDIKIVDYNFNPNSMDLILFRGTLQHLDKPLWSIQKCLKMLKPNGYIIFLATPNTNSIYYRLFNELPALDPKRNFLLPSDIMIKQILENLGLKVLQIRYPYIDSPYAKLISDHVNFFLKILGFNRNFAFWGNVMECYAKKP